jgi:tetratricopeptide (TPR) repeat protein
MPRDSYFGLENYMQHEGFTYRLVPYVVRSDRNQFGYFGEVEPNIMYHNMMEEFDYGNMEDPEIFLDENNLRFVTNLRLNFSRLAAVLLEQGDKEKAKAVLDRCVEKTVNDNAPSDLTLLQVAELYFKLNDAAGAENISKRMVEAYLQDLGYYASLETEFWTGINQEAGRAMMVIQQIQQYANQYKAESMKEYLDASVAQAQVYYDELGGDAVLRPRQ